MSLETEKFILSKSQILIFAVILFMLGISAYETGYFLVFLIISAIGIIFTLVKDFISPICAILLFSIFIGSFYYTDYKTKEFDGLELLSPAYNAVIEGTIITNLTSDKPAQTSFYLSADKFNNGKTSIPLKAKTMVTIQDEHEGYKKLIPGDRVRIKGNLFIPQPAGNPSQFDWAKYLKEKDVFTVFYAKEENCFEKLSSAQTLKWKFLQKIHKTKNKILSKHAKYIQSPKFEIVGGIVLGDDAVNPPTEVKDSFIKSGLFHMLAASGMNVAIIFGMCFFILRKLRVDERLSIFTGMIIVLLYTCMTGFPVSLLRASIMLEFILAGKLINRAANTYALLFFAAFLILADNPSVINDLGFKLSFIVTFGLIFMAPYISEKMSKVMPRIVADSIFVPLIAQLWVIPVQMFYFNTFTTYALFANILILPFFTITSFTGFVSFVLSLIPFIGSKLVFILSYILNFSSQALIYISDFFASLPHSILTMPKPSVLQIILYYTLLPLGFLALKLKSKKILSVSAAIFICLLLTFIPVRNRDCEVIFFSVSDADMILIKSPQGKYFMTDTGQMPYNAKSSQAKMIVEKYLNDRGVSEFEQIIITHYDSDHSGGLVTLMRDFSVKKLIANKNPKSTENQKAIDRELNRRKIKFHEAKDNELVYEEKDFSIKTFAAKELSKDPNASSIITLLTCKGHTILFMADTEVKTYNLLKRELPKTVDTIKIGHHGAKNSIDTNMANELQFKNAVISSGTKSANHPYYTILDILRTNGVNIHRTDSDNAIKIVINDNGETFYHFDSKEKKFKTDKQAE